MAAMPVGADMSKGADGKNLLNQALRFLLHQNHFFLQQNHPIQCHISEGEVLGPRQESGRRPRGALDHCLIA
jgi:hypothetical protein